MRLRDHHAGKYAGGADCVPATTQAPRRIALPPLLLPSARNLARLSLRSPRSGGAGGRRQLVCTMAPYQRPRRVADHGGAAAARKFALLLPRRKRWVPLTVIGHQPSAQQQLAVVGSRDGGHRGGRGHSRPCRDRERGCTIAQYVARSRASADGGGGVPPSVEPPSSAARPNPSSASPPSREPRG